MDNLTILRLVEAVGVVVLTPAIRAFLRENDPKCLQQCELAIEKAADEGSGKARKILNILRCARG